MPIPTDDTAASLPVRQQSSSPSSDAGARQRPAVHSRRLLEAVHRDDADALDAALRDHFFAALVEDPRATLGYLSRIPSRWAPDHPAWVVMKRIAARAVESGTLLSPEVPAPVRRIARTTGSGSSWTRIVVRLSALRSHLLLGRTRLAANEAEAVVHLVGNARATSSLTDLLPLALLAAGLAFVHAARMEQAVAALEDALRWARVTTPTHPAESAIQQALGVAFSVIGHHREAERRARDGRGIGAPAGGLLDSSVTRMSSVRSAFAAVAAVRDDDAARLVDSIGPNVEASVWWWSVPHLRARLALRGPEAGIRRALRSLDLDLLTHPTMSTPDTLAGLLLRVDQADLRLVLGDPAGARSSLASVDERHPLVVPALARIALIERRPHDALRRLEDHGPAGSAHGLTQPSSVAVLRAIALDQLGVRSAGESVAEVVDAITTHGDTEALCTAFGPVRSTLEERALLPSPLPACPYPAPPTGLTRREHEILEALRLYATNAEIAAALHLSRFTVKNHLHNIYRKLGVSDRREAVG